MSFDTEEVETAMTVVRMLETRGRRRVGLGFEALGAMASLRRRDESSGLLGLEL